MRHVDRRIAAVAHLSIGFGVIVGVGFLLGIAINVVIWLRSRRSSYVEFHAEQAGFYQLIVLVTNILIVCIWIGALIFFLGDTDVWSLQLSLRHVPMGLWCALLPLQVAWFFGTIFYGVYGGLIVAAGGEFDYRGIGPWVRRRLEARKK